MVVRTFPVVMDMLQTTALTASVVPSKRAEAVDRVAARMLQSALVLIITRRMQRAAEVALPAGRLPGICEFCRRNLKIPSEKVNRVQIETFGLGIYTGFRRCTRRKEKYMGVFTSDWQAVGASRSWRDSTVVLEHSLPANPLFSLSALGKLIDTLPRENYMLMHTGPVGTQKKLWEEGDIGGLSGDAVIEAIRQGNLWLLIRHVDQVSKPMLDLMESIYAEIDANVDGGYPTFNHVSDILISSPSAQVYYHFDHNGQALWQVHGSKRVYVYPNRPPFLTREMLEHTAVYADETAVPYDPSYDAAAKVYTLAPGQMIHWPLFSPHRIENLEFSVSYTLQYYTPEIRRRVKVHAANGLIHTKLPNLALKDDIRGPGYVIKAQLQSGLRRLGVMNRMAQSKRAIKFRLDPKKLGQIIPLQEKS